MNGEYQSGSRLTEQLRPYFPKQIFLINSLQTLTNKNPGEAVSGRINLI